MENDMETVTIQWLWRGLNDKNWVLAYNSPGYTGKLTHG